MGIFSEMLTLLLCVNNFFDVSTCPPVTTDLIQLDHALSTFAQFEILKLAIGYNANQPFHLSCP